MHRCKPNQKLPVIIVRGLVATESSASATLVRDHKSAALVVGLCCHGIHNRTAIGRAIPGIYVKMQAAEALRTVVARRVAEGRHLVSAVLADEPTVVFCKSFLIHIIPQNLFVVNIQRISVK